MAIAQTRKKRKPDQRDSWVEGSQAVAKRVERGKGWFRGAPPSSGRQRPWRGLAEAADSAVLGEGSEHNCSCHARFHERWKIT